MSEVYIWFRLGFTLHWVRSLILWNLSFWAEGFYRVKSVSRFRFTLLLQGPNQSPLFDLHCIRLITGSNQSPWFDVQGFYRVKPSLFFDIQGFYRVKSVSLFRFTILLQGQIGHSFSIYKVFTGSNRSLFFDLQGVYRVKSVFLFWFSIFLQCWMIPSLFDLQGFYRIIAMSQ